MGIVMLSDSPCPDGTVEFAIAVSGGIGLKAGLSEHRLSSGSPGYSRMSTTMCITWSSKFVVTVAQ